MRANDVARAGHASAPLFPTPARPAMFAMVAAALPLGSRHLPAGGFLASADGRVVADDVGLEASAG
eukprot:5792512-Lingulodinium_polyedra.AAC.1